MVMICTFTYGFNAEEYQSEVLLSSPLNPFLFAFFLEIFEYIGWELITGVYYTKKLKAGDVLQA